MKKLLAIMFLLPALAFAKNYSAQDKQNILQILSSYSTLLNQANAATTVLCNDLGHAGEQDFAKDPAAFISHLRQSVGQFSKVNDALEKLYIGNAPYRDEITSVEGDADFYDLPRKAELWIAKVESLVDGTTAQQRLTYVSAWSARQDGVKKSCDYVTAWSAASGQRMSAMQQQLSQ